MQELRHARRCSTELTTSENNCGLTISIPLHNTVFVYFVSLFTPESIRFKLADKNKTHINFLFITFKSKTKPQCYFLPINLLSRLMAPQTPNSWTRKNGSQQTTYVITITSVILTVLIFAREITAVLLALGAKFSEIFKIII